ANSHISAVPPLDLKEYLKQRIAESQESGDADTADRFAAVGFNIGTNLLRSAHNSIQIAIGIGFEGSFYQDLSENTKVTFTNPNDEVFQQLRNDKDLLIEMLDTQYVYL